MKWVILLAVGAVIGVSFLPVHATQPTPFADPSFSRFFSRLDVSGRTMLWGDAPLVSLVEPYTGAPGNRRLVQYFDRGRMELDAVTGTVTEGRLVREMTSGLIQLGDDTYSQGIPADIPVLATSANNGVDAGPTYADFTAVTGSAAPDLTAGSSTLNAWLVPGGQVVQSNPPVALSAALYVGESGHNISGPLVVWLNSGPFGSLSWQDALGYPISEPYWVHADGRDRLVQLFERRVVVYTPSLPVGEQISLTNAGRHYYRWRYGDEPGNEPRQNISSSTGSEAAADLILPEGYHATTVLNGTGDIVDLAVAPDARILVAHSGGTVTEVAASGGAEKTVIDGLSGPVAVTSVGTTIFVVDSAGLHRYHDNNGDGSVDLGEEVVPLPFIPSTVTLSPGPDGTLYLAGTEQDDRNRSSTMLRWDETTGTLEKVPAVYSGDGVFVVDVGGTIWAADPTGELVRFAADDTTRHVLSLEGIAAPTATAGAGDSPGPRSIRDLLLYRPDGTIGDAASDMLALVSDADGGRIVRLRPSGGATTTQGAAGGAIVDFITGFDDPVAVVAGLDGSLYVADDGTGALYRITPP